MKILLILIININLIAADMDNIDEESTSKDLPVTIIAKTYKFKKSNPEHNKHTFIQPVSSIDAHFRWAITSFLTKEIEKRVMICGSEAHEREVEVTRLIREQHHLLPGNAFATKISNLQVKFLRQNLISRNYDQIAVSDSYGTGPDIIRVLNVNGSQEKLVYPTIKVTKLDICMGKIAVSGKSEKSAADIVKVYDVKSGNEIFNKPLYEGEVDQLMFVYFGEHIAIFEKVPEPKSGLYNYTLLVYDMQGRYYLYQIYPSSYMAKIPSGEAFCFADINGILNVFKYVNGQLKRSQINPQIARLIKYQTRVPGIRIPIIEHVPANTKDKPICKMAMANPDLCLALDQDGTLKLIDIKNAIITVVHKYKSDEDINSLSVSEDGKRIYALLNSTKELDEFDLNPPDAKSIKDASHAGTSSDANKTFTQQ